jgi:hypothetical protein
MSKLGTRLIKAAKEARAATRARPLGPRFVVLRAERASAADFVSFWAARYDYPDYDVYKGNIGLLTRGALLNLFEWKNGRALSEAKKRSVEQNYLDRLGYVRELGQIDGRGFLNAFPTGGAIWRTFWLHCCHHLRHPIFDQHVYRAMIFLQEGDRDELERYSDPEKIDLYLDRYSPFFGQFADLNV